MATLRITQMRSTIGRPAVQRRTLRALGLRKIGHTVEHEDSPSLRGMIRKVSHLVRVETAPSTGAPTAGERPRGQREGP